MSHRRARGAVVLALSIGLGSVVVIPTAVAAEPVYYLPAPEGTALVVSQGDTGAFRRTDGRVASERYALDFITPDEPEPFAVLAARGGTVIGQRAGMPGGRCTKPQSGPRPSCWRNVNYVLIDHGDGTSGLYLHLKRSQPIVRVGQVISAGQRIGTAGSSGWTDEVGLRFQVQPTPPWNAVGSGGWFETRSQPVSFSDPDVLTQRADGIPQTNDIIISGNTGPAFDPFRFRRRPMVVPASVPFEVGAERELSDAYDAGSSDGYGLHFAPEVEVPAVDQGRPLPSPGAGPIEATMGTEVRPLLRRHTRLRWLRDRVVSLAGTHGRDRVREW